VTLDSGDIVPATRRPEFFQPDLVLIHTRHSDANLDWIQDWHLVLDPRYPDAVAGVLS
jgi:UDP-N-acetyl-D-glucosamine dehydrogenase